ncbi:MAG TPA: VOC family protein [Kofleriaceae bacterium]|nr:VOC family protein [Kofleriaceae bacterium]
MTAKTGWPSISSAVYYDDAAAAIDFLSRALGFEVRLKIEGEGGVIEHSELTFGDAVIMVGTVGDRRATPERAFAVSPRSTGGGNTQTLCLRVESADAACERARAAGAKVEIEPATQDYGDDYDSHRTCLVADPEGHRWWLMQVMREAPPRAK